MRLLTLSLALMDWHVPRWVQCQEPICRILTAMCMHALQANCTCTAMALLLPTFGKRPQDQGNAPRKRTAATSPATEQTLRTPADAGASTQDPRNAPPPGSSCSSTVADAATEHIQLGSTPEAPPGSGAASADVAITSIDDVVSKLALEPEESAGVLCSAARILQKRVQAEVRRLCVCPVVCY